MLERNINWPKILLVFSLRLIFELKESMQNRNYKFISIEKKNLINTAAECQATEWCHDGKKIRENLANEENV